ncbi:unnamed protein product [Alopecurus aequalis]
MEKRAEAPEAELSRKLMTSYIEQIVTTTRNFTGYENPGKSLYMVIREMVENSLDAIEQATVDHPYVNIVVESVEGKTSGVDQMHKVSCKDNGIGVKHAEIPAMFAQLLQSSKSEHRQTRGKFGMGVKNALLYSMDKTSKPMEVESEVMKSMYKSMYELRMDIDTGTPIIVKEQQETKEPFTQGTQVALTVFGNWASYRNNILNFIRQTAMVTPYVSFNLTYIYNVKRAPYKLNSPRNDTEKPCSPRTAKYDPSSFFQKARSLPGGHLRLADFLINEFDGVDKKVATDFIAKLGSTLFQEINCDCLTPLGVHLIAGVKFLLGDDVLLGEYRSKPSSYEGHPYIVEAVITTLDSSAPREGFATIVQGLNIFRFANRTPLLLEGTSDVIVQVAKKIGWDTYGLHKLEDKICIFVSFVSTYVPFTGLAKEAISGRQNIPTVIQEVLEGCCNDFLAKKKPGMSKRQRVVDAAVKYHVDMMRGCTRMTDAAEPQHVLDFNKDHLALDSTESMYREKLEERYMMLNKDKLI